MRKRHVLRLNAELTISEKNIKRAEEFIKYANEKLIQEFIDVFESLWAGNWKCQETDNKDKLIEGMELVYKQFKVVLERNGLVPIKALGENSTIQGTSNDANTYRWSRRGYNTRRICQGYMLNGKILRYSKVRVSKKKGSEEKSDNE